MGGRLVSPLFVGRGDALAAAATALEQIQAGRASHLLVAGEAGIGKTRFAAAVVDAAAARGFRVASGGCAALGSGELPYAGLAEALRDLARGLDRAELASLAGDDADVLSRIAPALGAGRPASSAPPSPREPSFGAPAAEVDRWGLARRRLLEALRALLERLAAAGPILVVIEDLHWADSATLDTLSFLLRSLREDRAGLLLTFRLDELGRRHPLVPWLGEVERLATVERLDIGPLAPAETTELIRAIRGVDPSVELASRIHDRSDGNPFFIEELLAQDQHGGTMQSLSPTLHDILGARVRSLPDESQALLAVAAVAGRRVDTALLAAVAGVTDVELDAPLAACLESRLLVPDDADGRDRLAFRHALVQELVYDDILPAARVRLHRRFAQELSARPAVPGSADPGRWAQIAYHWDAARDEPRAFDAALHAADEAEHAYAFGAALARYRRAISGWQLVADPASAAGFDHVELLSRAAVAACLSRDAGEIPLLREAIAEADRMSDPGRAAVLRGRLGTALWMSGDASGARLAYSDAIALMTPGRPTVEHARILAGLGQVLMLDGSNRESRRLCEEAIEMARTIGDRGTEAHALTTLATVLGALGRCGLAVESIERALAIALELDDPDVVGRAYVNATEILGACGRADRALELVRQGVERTSAMGMGHYYPAFLRLHGIVIAYELGDWAESARLAAECPHEWAEPTIELYALAHVVELQVGTGAWEAASATLARIGELLATFETEYQHAGPYGCARAELALWQAGPDDAILAVEEAIGRLEGTDDRRYRPRLLRFGLRACADLAERARGRGDHEAEAAARSTAEDLCRRTAPARAALTEMDGGIALDLLANEATVAAENTRLDGASDPGAWRTAAGRWLAAGRPYLVAYARWREAEAWLRLGDRPSGAEALRAAVATADTLGARPLRAALAGLARRARIPLDSPASSTPGPPVGPADPAAAIAARLGLTPREREVLELLARGMTNRQIAETLYISVYTVGIHVSRILGKLDATGRTEAAATAHRLGLVGASG